MTPTGNDSSRRALTRIQLRERARKLFAVLRMHIVSEARARQLLHRQTEDAANGLTAEHEAAVGIQLPDPVLDRVHNVSQALLALADQTLGVAPAYPFDDFAQSTVHRRDESRRIVLEDVVDGSVAQRLDGALFTQRAGDENEWHVRGLTHGDIQGGQPVEAGDREIRQDDVRSEAAQRRPEAALRVDADVHAVDASRAQLPDGEVRVGGVILDDQYA